MKCPLNGELMSNYSKRIRVPGKSVDELYSRAAKGVEKILSQVGSGYDVVRDEERHTMELNSKWVKAFLKVQNEEIVLDAKLSFLARPFKSKIDGWIAGWAEKEFGIKS
jgi:hypothetical protein